MGEGYDRYRMELSNCYAIYGSRPSGTSEAILAKEAGDRADIGLPQAQVDFLRQLAAAGAKIVLVLAGGSAFGLEAVPARQ